MFSSRNCAIWIAAFVCALSTRAQDATPRRVISPSDRSAISENGAAAKQAIEIITLNVPRGTPLQVGLDKDVRVRREGQPVHGRIVEPVYSFDKLVIPVGSEVFGKIAKIDPISRRKRTLAALNVDFTPPRVIHLDFTELVLPGGKRFQIETTVTPGSGHAIQFVTSPGEPSQKKGAKNAVSGKAGQAKEQAKQEWDNAIGELKAPGKWRRIGHYALAQLPMHPQYIGAGAIYFAELHCPLNFGTERVATSAANSVGALPADGAVVHARLITALDSGTARKGDEVVAIVSQPVFEHDQLLIAQGTILKGTVLEVHRARSMARSGQLRIVFREFTPPGQIQQPIEGSMVGVQAASASNVKLDSEGGAKATPPKTRLLATTAEVGLGGISFLGDTFGDTGPRTAGGAGAFKLIGIIIGLSVHSQTLGKAMGAYGGARSIYVNFIAKGHELVFPKNTAMQISVESRQATRKP